MHRCNAEYNPFFEKAGMTLAGKMELQPGQKKLLAFIESAGGKVSLLHNKAFCKAFLNSLDSEQIGNSIVYWNKTSKPQEEQARVKWNNFKKT